MYKFKLINCDTDSIMVNKPDGSEFTKEERLQLVGELNSIMPEGINWEEEGVFTRVIVVKIKNYILYDGKNIVHKGSSLKATTKEPALKQFITDVINSMIAGNYNFVEIYNQYVKEIQTLTDITRWCTRKTITNKVLNGTRLNEGKVKDAILGYEYVEGDRAHFYYKSDDSLSLVENFDGDYNKDRLLSKLYLTSQVFKTVIDPKLFINYSLKRSKPLLAQLV